MSSATATKPPQAKVKDWVYWYKRAITNQAPCPAIMVEDTNEMGVATLIAFSRNGIETHTGVHPYTSEQVQSNPNIAREGCWSPERLDK